MSTNPPDELCRLVMNINKSIQSVAIINKLGRAIERISRPNFSMQLPNNMSEVFFMQCVLQISMGREFDEHYGPVNYHLYDRGNLVMLSFPIDKDVLLVTATKNASPISLASRIADVIKSHKPRPQSSLVVGQ